MRMRDLKDALKGKTERLERAEALLIEAMRAIDEGLCNDSDADDMCNVLYKIEQYFFKKKIKTPIDNEK